MTQILIVEDEQNLARFNWNSHMKITMWTQSMMERGLDKALSHYYDLIILDNVAVN